MSPIKYGDYAVAFIDLLGFSEVVMASERDENALFALQRVMGLLSDAVGNLNRRVVPEVPEAFIPKPLYVFDSLVISSPLRGVSEDGRPLHGLDAVVIRCIQVCHILLNDGYLVRGGIAVGKAWQEEKNIVGPACVAAVAIEKTTKMPRIEIHESALPYSRNLSEPVCRMCITYDEKLMVNSLHDYYLPDRDSPGALEAAYARYAATANRNSKHADEGVAKKWQWFAGFLQSETRRAAGYMAADR